MNTFKKILLTLLAVLCLAALAVGVQWYRFEPPAVVGGTAQGVDDVERSVNWLNDYAAQLGQWNVPPSRRIKSLTVTDSEDLGEGCVRLDYTFTTLLTHARFHEEFSQCIDSHEGKTFVGCMVIRWQDGAITEVMREAGWQIAYSPWVRAEREQPETQHYNPVTYAGQAYLVQDETLYVTYDGGESYVEVPDGYALVCARSSGGNVERMTDNQYIVTPNLTAFLVYGDDENAYLYFSRDMGQTWQKNLIAPGYQANSFLSLTEDGVYASFAVDRGLGSDYYATCFSSDLITWTAITQPGHDRNYSCVYWPEPGVGYFSGGTVEYTSGETKNVQYVTFDNGATYQTIEYTPVWSFVEDAGGIDSFDTLYEMYDEDGVRYMVLSQHEGQAVRLRYRSTDGLNFEFDEQFDDNAVEAG